MLDEKEIVLGRKVLESALSKGADKARVTLNKCTMDLIGTLNGEIDKVTHCLDLSMSISLFVDGRFGTFSTNRLEENALDSFLDKAVSAVKTFATDPCRDLPDPSRTAKNATNGRELGLYDPEYDGIDSTARIKAALEASIFASSIHEGTGGVISEEGEYSDNDYDSVTMDTAGLFCRHRETSFDYGVEITVNDGLGGKVSDQWWHSSPFRKSLDLASCGTEALRRAISHIGAKPVSSRRTNMVVSRDVAFKLVSPLLDALGGYAIQQKNSFLADSLDRKVFPDGLTILDCAHRKGESGSRLFDSEGIATVEDPVIEKGVVKKYFINTFISKKTGLTPTIEDITRPMVMPWPAGTEGQDEIISACPEGIFVTGFNGGNCNSSTGDFSYGIEGFVINNGKIGEPVHEMVVTGNFKDLWNRLTAAGNDIRVCMSKLIPTLAFSNVDFSGQDYEY